MELNRRAFINGVARGGLFGALAVLAGILVYRGQVSPTRSCDLNFQCRSCRRLDRCGLPEASTERNDGKEG